MSFHTPVHSTMPATRARNDLQHGEIGIDFTFSFQARRRGCLFQRRGAMRRRSFRQAGGWRSAGEAGAPSSSRRINCSPPAPNHTISRSTTPDGRSRARAGGRPPARPPGDNTIQLMLDGILELQRARAGSWTIIAALMADAAKCSDLFTITTALIENEHDDIRTDRGKRTTPLPLIDHVGAAADDDQRTGK